MAEVLLLPAARRELESLEGALFARIRAKLLTLATVPRPPGALKLTGDGGYRLRAGDYRILDRIDDGAGKAYVYRVKHRREAYR